MDADENAVPMTRRGAIPTNMISYKGRKIPARIDPEARINHVVEIMSNSFGTKEHHITLCLRDEADHLVTQSNLPSKVINHDALKLVPSPTTEALAVVTSLKVSAQQPKLESTPPLNTQTQTEGMGIPLKLALFNLQKYIKEEDFAVEFMMRGGMRMLVRMLERDGEGGLAGNSLAYALQGVRGILEYEASWTDLTTRFIDRMLALLIHATQPNVLRPTTAIVRKLVISPSQVRGEGSGWKSPALSSLNKGKGKGREDEVNTPDLGIDAVFARMEELEREGGSATEGQEGPERVFRVVAKRLEGTGDLELVAQSLGLINASLRSAYQDGSKNYPSLVSIVERIGVRRAVSRLIPISSNNIVEPQILNFQARHAAILQYRRLRPVRPAQNAEQEKMLVDIWAHAHLGDARSNGVGGGEVPSGLGGQRSLDGWRKIGLGYDEAEDQHRFAMETDLFRDTGELGLECLHWFAAHDEDFYNLVMEQLARPGERRCPIGRASSECVKILCEHYKISQAGHHAPSHFQLFLLNFSRLHHLVLRFFIRMWAESESRLEDLARVTLLVHSQVRLSLEDEAGKTWLNLEKDLLESEYSVIRDRQMQMLEKEDGMMGRKAVRELREKVGGEAYEVMSEQRIGCMLQGAWFNAANVIVQGVTVSARPSSSKPLRFLRLSPNRRTIAWGDFATREPVKPSFESLRERIDVSNVTDVRLKTGCAIHSRSPNLVSRLSFSLMSGGEFSLLDLDAIHAAQLAEWTDGIRVLRGDGGMMSGESANYVHILTELALKVRLLDITGDGVEIPEKVSFGATPKSVDFWFAK
ncbi:hypothetical protein EHS25_000272 [Saitozyma podzolica]|uniref:ELMO domain-containing protein n=1 Tax=Saitozyma podzolica TaxID=1890683 RepID=A0A427YVX4_9TREE|nr:hypothetical protein EHS25_000272 [Saitozyma podzolica]